MTSNENLLVAIEWCLISLLFFENKWIADKTITKIIFAFISFIFEILYLKSKVYWRYWRIIFDLINETFFFLPKIFKFIVIFHYLFNFVCKLYLMIITISILYELPKYIINFKKMMLNQHKLELQLLLKYLSVFLMFAKHYINRATMFLAVMFIVDLIKIHIKRHYLEK